MADEKTVLRAREIAQQITQVPLDQLIANPVKWGPVNFESARADLALIFALAEHLRQLPIELVPQGIVTGQFEPTLSAALAHIETLKAFTIEDGSSPTKRRDQIVQEVKASAEQLLTVTQGWIGFLAYQKGDVQRNIEALNDAVSTAKTLLNNATVDVNGKKGTLDGIIAAARDAAASVGVAHFTADFAGQATKFELEASWWLKWTAGLGAASVVTAFAFFWLPVPANAGAAQLVQYMTSKVVLLGVLITATVWCGRIYRGTRHQAALNEHRAHALKSFQAFVKATDDEATKNAVLLETTRSIFAMGPSGFLDASDSSGDGSSKILEIVKGSSRGAGS